MKQDTNSQPPPRFRPRDAAVLAIVCLSTFALLAGGLEFTARRLFRRSSTIVWSCFAEGASGAGILPIPNSVCREKLPESPLVEYRFNACGYRTLAACGPRPAGTLRIVLVGSSFVMGYQVPYQQTFGVLLQQKLAAATARAVEVDNQGMLFGTPRRTALHFRDALAATPDLILWTLSPWDVDNVVQTQDELPLAKVDRTGGPPPPKWRRYLDAWRQDGIQTLLLGSRSVLLMRHLLFQSPTQYMRNYLMQKDEPGIFAKQPSALWRKRWDELDAIAKDMVDRAKAAGVPFAVAAVPDLAGALMLSSGDWPAQLDPVEFGDHVRSLAESHGGVYLDVLPAFRAEPSPEQLFYTVDGHMNAGGHALIARLLADRISSGILPALERREAAPSRLASR
jgi:hypothetical protein